MKQPFALLFIIMSFSVGCGVQSKEDQQSPTTSKPKEARQGRNGEKKKEELAKATPADKKEAPKMKEKAKEEDKVKAAEGEKAKEADKQKAEAPKAAKDKKEEEQKAEGDEKSKAGKSGDEKGAETKISEVTVDLEKIKVAVISKFEKSEVNKIIKTIRAEKIKVLFVDHKIEGASENEEIKVENLEEDKDAVVFYNKLNKEGKLLQRGVSASLMAYEHFHALKEIDRPYMDSPLFLVTAYSTKLSLLFMYTEYILYSAVFGKELQVGEVKHSHRCGLKLAETEKKLQELIEQKRKDNKAVTTEQIIEAALLAKLAWVKFIPMDMGIKMDALWVLYDLREKLAFSKEDVTLIVKTINQLHSSLIKQIQQFGREIVRAEATTGTMQENIKTLFLEYKAVFNKVGDSVLKRHERIKKTISPATPSDDD